MANVAARLVAHTVVSPVIIEGNPIVTVPRDSATSISFDVPEKITALPKDIATFPTAVIAGRNIML